jgi:hypothetical protein
MSAEEEPEMIATARVQAAAASSLVFEALRRIHSMNATTSAKDSRSPIGPLGQPRVVAGKDESCAAICAIRKVRHEASQLNPAEIKGKNGDRMQEIRPSTVTGATNGSANKLAINEYVEMPS